MIRAVAAVALLEVRIALRNRRAVLSAACLLIFSLVIGLFSSSPAEATAADPLAIAVASLGVLSVYLVPLVALLLAFDSIAGEIERGTLQLVLSTPLNRHGFLLGKCLGQFLVAGTMIAASFGLTGALVCLVTDGGTAAGVAALFRLIVAGAGLAAVFLAIGHIASASVRQTGTAAALAIGIWLLAVVLYDLALLGGLVLDGDGVFARRIFPWLLVANPADAFRLYVLASPGIGDIATGPGGAGKTMPFPAEVAPGVLLAWIAGALVAACLVFRKIEP